jgi:serine/threonine protein phosphatase PrpC
MVSDGIASAQDDLWLYQLMEESNGTEPKELSCAIMEKAMERYGHSDDMTVLVLGIKKRNRKLKNAG